MKNYYFIRKFNLLYLVYQGLLNKNYIEIIFSILKELIYYESLCDKIILNNILEMKCYSFLKVSSSFRNKFNLEILYY